MPFRRPYPVGVGMTSGLPVIQEESMFGFTGRTLGAVALMLIGDEHVTFVHSWKRLADELTSRTPDPMRVSALAWVIGFEKKYP